MNTNVPIKKVIDVINNVVSSGQTSGFIPQGLFLTKNLLLPTQTVLAFTSVDSVGAYFGTTSEEYKIASFYFTAETININTPPSIYFARYTDTAIAPFTRGTALNVNTDLSLLKAITNGSMTVTFGGTNFTLTTVDLSTKTSFSDIATFITAELVTAGLTHGLCTFDTITQAFTITNGVINTTVNYCSDSPLSIAMKINKSSGAVLSQGLDVQTPADNMNYIINQTTNFVIFTTVFDASLENAPFATITGLIAWNNTQGHNYVYFPWTINNNQVSFPQSTLSLSYYLATNGWGSVAPTGQIKFNSDFSVYYANIDFISGQMGTMASIDFTQTNATKSLDAKTYSGIVPLVTTKTEYEMALLNGCNFYARFASRGNTYVWSENGSLGGSFLWTTNLINQAWFNDAITVAEANLKASLPILPFSSIALLKDAILAVCTQGIKNGVITSGNTFSNQEKSILKQQSGGLDIASILTLNGFYVLIGTPTAESRSQGKLAPVNIWYTNGGNINTISNILTLVI